MFQLVSEWPKRGRFLNRSKYGLKSHSNLSSKRAQKPSDKNWEFAGQLKLSGEVFEV